MEYDANAYSQDAFLGGRVMLTQPRKGYRVAMDSVLLAASVPAKPHDRVLEGGLGSAGAALCLAARVGHVHVHGIERDAEMRALATHNIAQNSMSDQIQVIDGCISDLSRAGSSHDHVMINPPFLADGAAVAPPAKNKGAAHMHRGTTLVDWIKWAVHHCKARGTISIVYRADYIDQIVAGLAGRTGDMMVMPFWPVAGQPARRVIVQARKSTQGRAVLLPGIALHEDGRRYSRAAEAILRDAAFLDLKGLARGAG